MPGIIIDHEGTYAQLSGDGTRATVEGAEAQTMGVKKAAELQKKLAREGLEVTIFYKGSGGLELDASDPRTLSAALRRLPEALGTSAIAEGMAQIGNQLAAAAPTHAARPAAETVLPSDRRQLRALPAVASDELEPRAPVQPIQAQDIPIDKEGNYAQLSADGRKATLSGTEAETMGIRQAAALQRQLAEHGLDVKVKYKGSGGVELTASDPKALQAALQRIPEALGTSPNSEALQHHPG